MMQHLMGNLLYEVVLGQILNVFSPSDFATTIWPGAFVLYPWERLVLVILSVVVGVPLVKTLKKSLLPFQKPPSQE
jgi:hypothetical protein